MLVLNTHNGSAPKWQEGLIQQRLGPVSYVSTKHVVEHSHIDHHLSTARSYEDSAPLAIAPDQTADAYSAIPMYDSVTVSSPVSVSSNENTSSASLPVARPARSRKPIRRLIGEM